MLHENIKIWKLLNLYKIENKIILKMNNIIHFRNPLKSPFSCNIFNEMYIYAQIYCFFFVQHS